MSNKRGISDAKYRQKAKTFCFFLIFSQSSFTCKVTLHPPPPSPHPPLSPLSETPPENYASASSSAKLTSSPSLRELKKKSFLNRIPATLAGLGVKVFTHTSVCLCECVSMR